MKPQKPMLYTSFLYPPSSEAISAVDVLPQTS